MHLQGGLCMGARLRVFLTHEQDRTLLNLRKQDVPQKVKDRAEVIRLNAHGWYVENIASHFDWNEKTVRKVLHEWNNLGLEGLWELPGRGGKPRWKEDDIVFLEECLRIEPRTYNSSQLALRLKTERNVQLSPDRLRRVLKKRGSIGSVQEKVIKENKTR
ncbi:transposase (plasmid) [Calothrix sp. PCC 7716]|nr:transposase [Calothrix sp. PCC 7716]